MNKRKKMVSILAGFMAVVMLLTLIIGLLPPRANAASSKEIRNQINQLKKEKEEIKGKIKEVQGQFEENENEIENIIAKKLVVDQEIQLLTVEIVNINEQISAYNILIADKQDELDTAEGRYVALNEANKLRVRTMEEEGELSYWEVLFKANSFSDLLDRLNMVEEIAASDRRRIKELSEAADQVVYAQDALTGEKAELELTKADLDRAEADLEAKNAEAEALLQELFAKADDLEALKAEFEKMESDFIDEIAKKEVEFNEAKEAEWLAWLATSVPPTTAPPQNNGGSTGGGNNGGGSNGGSNNGGGIPSGGGGWIVPCNYTSITSPFGYRDAPTSGASSYHQGVDLDTGTGWPVYATRAGYVAIAGSAKAAGNYIKIDHRDGFQSIYMHLNSIGVRSGQMVTAGQKIGTTGSSGITTGDHLHFGIIKNGVYVNPASYVPLH